MPIYVYQCQHCKAKTEAIQKVQDPPPEICKHCQKSGTLKKIMSPISSRRSDSPLGTTFDRDGIPAEAYQPLAPQRQEHMVKDEKTGHYVEADSEDPTLDKKSS